MSRARSGFFLLRASRTEALADALAARLVAERPDNALAPQRVVVAHPGLGRWLLQRFAAARGADGRAGIAANLHFELPGAWLGRLMAELLDEPLLGAGPYRREHLRWLVHEELAALDEAELRRYLGGDDAARRRLQLADHLAGLYTQYLVYRRDWILEAEHGREDHWQARLWARVRERADAPHRAGRMQALLARLERGALPRDPAPVHVFGVNHLPPDTLSALALLARRRGVHLYFPDPCPQQFWHDIVSETELARRIAEDSVGYREVAHPLLAALGAHGQQFNRLLTPLVEGGAAAASSDALEEPDEDGDGRLLAVLQHSVRCLDAGVLQACTPSAEDASLRVHACHTRLRELEVLRDALLARLAGDPSLQPRDIVVMAPDIGAYAPLLPAVFGADGAGEAGDRRHIPWQLADRTLGALHPLLATFAELLMLPSSRVTLSQVLALLDVPAVARALQLGAGERAALETWLRRARVAWGLDEHMKHALSGSRERRHSFAFGRDRLMLGWLVGDEAAFEGFEGIVPVAGVDGADAPALGKLDALLALLAEARAVCAEVRSASDWSEWLRGWLQRLFVPDPADAEEVAALSAALGCAAALQRECEGAGVDPELPWPAVQQALSMRLAEVPGTQRFLIGGVTFCGMVPARVIPFRVVALLGLDDGEFPRDGGASALNLMQRTPRAGDRDPRREDRYLFLECLMAARDSLHLSYRGESAADGGTRNPASPLAELLEFLDASFGVDALDREERDAARPWLLRHALQPFDARYFDRSDTRMFSYAHEYADAAPARVPREPAPFVDAPEEASVDAPVERPAGAGGDAADVLTLQTLQRLLRDPSRGGMERGLHLRLDALEDAGHEDSEPLDAAPDRREAIPRRLLLRLLAEGATRAPGTAPPWLADSGLLPPGLPGEQQYAHAAAHADAALAWIARELPWLPGGQAAPRALRVALDDGSVLEGLAPRVHAGADGAACVLDVRLDGAANLPTLLSLYVEWAALLLATPEDAPLPRPVLVCTARDKLGRIAAAADPRVAAWTADVGDEGPLRTLVRGRLTRLAALARSLVANPRWLPPGTTWAFLDAPADKRLAKAREAWEGGFHRSPESSYRPHAALAARGRRPLAPGTPEHARFLADARVLADVLGLELPA